MIRPQENWKKIISKEDNYICSHIWTLKEMPYMEKTALFRYSLISGQQIQKIIYVQEVYQWERGSKMAEE